MKNLKMWLVILGSGVFGWPLAIVVWSALVSGSSEAMTALWVLGGVVVFVSGGATVLVGQWASMKMNKSMFVTNQKENAQIMDALARATKNVAGAQVAASKVNESAALMGGPPVVFDQGLSGGVGEPKNITPPPKKGITVAQGAFNNLEQ